MADFSIRRFDVIAGEARTIAQILPAAQAIGAVPAHASEPGHADAVADAVVEYLEPVRERYHELRSDEAELERILECGAEKAHAIARETVLDVREVMGVGPVRERR